MKFSYDVKLPPKKSFKGGDKSEEQKAIEAFLDGTQKNMCITYDTDKEAKRRLSTLQSTRRNSETGVLYDLYRNGESLYVVRLSPAEVKERRKQREEKKKERSA